MTDAPLPSAPVDGRLRWTRPARALAARVSSAVRRMSSRLPDVEGMAVLARRLAPVAITLFLAEGFFFAGYFFEPILNLPLGLLTITALVGITARDYRADMRQQALIAELRRQSSAVVEKASRRRADLLEDMSRLTGAAVEAATLPVLLNAQLAAMAPVLVELLATPSAARREHLLDELERVGVAACAELLGDAGADGRAVLYRRLGGRFEPSWPAGRWASAPPSVTSRSGQGQELRLVLRQRRVAQTTVSTPNGSSRLSVRIPLSAGRRSLGVLCAERQGDAHLDPDELRAITVVVLVLAAVRAGTHSLALAERVTPSDRARARWARQDVGLADLAGLTRLTQADVIARLESSVQRPESRQAVRAMHSPRPMS